MGFAAAPRPFREQPILSYAVLLIDMLIVTEKYIYNIVPLQTIRP